MEHIDNIRKNGLQQRTRLLVGPEKFDKIAAARVLIFGVGGVGSWCAEGLVRSGIQHITIVDSDLVCMTNCNRQLIATSSTIGRPKVEILRERLLDINPYAEVNAIQARYNAETADQFDMGSYDFIVDAIDSLEDKIDLMVRATALPETITLISSMGAARRLDPSQVRVTEYWKVKGDPLGHALRKRMRRTNNLPSRKFQCVYSEELPMENLGTNALYDNEQDQIMVEGPGYNPLSRINGSLCPVTSVFGMTIASLILRKITNL